MSVLTNVLTPSKRKAIYSTYSSIGLGLGATAASNVQSAAPPAREPGDDRPRKRRRRR